MELGGCWGLLRLFLRPVFRPHGKPPQAGLEFRQNPRFSGEALFEAVVVLSIRWFYVGPDRSGIDSKQLVYERVNNRFTLFVRHLGYARGLERGFAFEAP